MPAGRRYAPMMVAGIALALSVPIAIATHTTEEGLSTEGCAVTKGGWGAEPNGHNPGALLHEWFDEVFPSGLTVGDLFFEDAQDVTDFLPNGGEQLEEQAVALAINIAFGNEGLLEGTVSGVEGSSDNMTLDGMTADEALEEAEEILLEDDTPTNAEYSDLIELITGFNEEEFGCLELCPDMDLTAIPNADGSISLNWTDVGADEYNIYRGADGGGLTFLDSTTDTEYNDTTTANGVTYSYAISIVNDERESGFCARAEATAIPFFPAPILGLLAVAGSIAAYSRWKRT